MIIISSVLTWGASEPNMVDDKPPPQLDENGEPIPEKSEEELEKEEEAKRELENKKRIEEGLEPIIPKIKVEDYDWEDDVEVEDDNKEPENPVKDVDGNPIPTKVIKWVYKEFEEERDGELVVIKKKGKKKIVIKEIKVFNENNEFTENKSALERRSLGR